MDEPFIECGKGWAVLYDPIIALCREDGVTIQQIKQKFGSLRIYVGAASPKIREEIASAERASIFICEDCGEPAQLRDFNGLLATVCDTHAEAMKGRSHE